MRTAIATEGNMVSPHFGRCPEYTVVETENGKVVKRETLVNPGHQPGFIPEFLNGKGVECIVAGGMGGRALQLFEGYGIRVIVGVSGTVEDTVNKLLEGRLAGGESFCKPGAGKGMGVEKTQCDHGGES